MNNEEQTTTPTCTKKLCWLWIVLSIILAINLVILSVAAFYSSEDDAVAVSDQTDEMIVETETTQNNIEISYQSDISISTLRPAISSEEENIDTCYRFKTGDEPLQDRVEEFGNSLFPTEEPKAGWYGLNAFDNDDWTHYCEDESIIVLENGNVIYLGHAGPGDILTYDDTMMSQYVIRTFTENDKHYIVFDFADAGFGAWDIYELPSPYPVFTDDTILVESCTTHDSFTDPNLGVLTCSLVSNLQIETK